MRSKHLNRSTIKNHLRENYLMYLVFFTIFVLVLVALQNNGLKRSGLSQKQRDEVKEMIQNAEMPKNNRIMIYLIMVIVIGGMLFYYFILKPEKVKHQRILQNLKIQNLEKKQRNRTQDITGQQ